MLVFMDVSCSGVSDIVCSTLFSRSVNFACIWYMMVLNIFNEFDYYLSYNISNA